MAGTSGTMLLMPAVSPRREVLRSWGPLAVVLGIVAVALVALVVGYGSSADGNCESMPLPMFNLAGTTYVARHADDIVPAEQIGEALGQQDGDIPAGLLRCEHVRLKTNQGTIGEAGAKVYAIRGVDATVAIAALSGREYIKLWST
jgi:hypothetical protein